MSNYSILIAEDESIIALDVKGILEKSGYIVVSLVRDGETLLKKVREELPSLIVMDIYLKDKTSGIELANKIWGQYDIPVIFLSGIDLQSLKKNLDFSKCDFIKKPFREAELLKAVKKFLQ